jgi:hypothetical protein
VLRSFLYRAPQRTAYQWTRNGADIYGATDIYYTAFAPGDYRCRVTASNAAGSTAQTSTRHTLPGPPETKIIRTRVSLPSHRVTFEFRAVGDGSGFRCRLARPHNPGTLQDCRSPKTYKHLRPGRYLFIVRALGPGGPDPTAARKWFRIRPHGGSKMSPPFLGRYAVSRSKIFGS